MHREAADYRARIAPKHSVINMFKGVRFLFSRCIRDAFAMHRHCLLEVTQTQLAQLARVAPCNALVLLNC
jgi:hypothetical protein